MNKLEEAAHQWADKNPYQIPHRNENSKRILFEILWF